MCVGCLRAACECVACSVPVGMGSRVVAQEDSEPCKALVSMDEIRTGDVRHVPRASTCVLRVSVRQGSACSVPGEHESRGWLAQDDTLQGPGRKPTLKIRCRKRAWRCDACLV